LYTKLSIYLPIQLSTDSDVAAVSQDLQVPDVGWWPYNVYVAGSFYATTPDGEQISQFIYKNDLFCQDRLGTNIGKTQTEKRLYINQRLNSWPRKQQLGALHRCWRQTSAGYQRTVAPRMPFNDR